MRDLKGDRTGQESRIARARAGLPRGGSDRAGKEHCLALEQQSGEPSVK